MTAKEEAKKLASYVKAMLSLPKEVDPLILEMCADALSAQKIRVQVALRSTPKEEVK